MDPLAPSDEAYKSFEQASANPLDEGVDFEGVVLPALTFLSQHPEKITPSLTRYALEQITVQECNPEQLKTCVEFIKKTEELDADNLCIKLLYLLKIKNGLAAALFKSYEGPALSSFQMETLLYIAIEHNHFDFLEIVYEKTGSIPSDALNYAIQKGKLDAIDYLLKKGCTTDFTDLLPRPEAYPCIQRVVEHQTKNLSDKEKRELISKAIQTGSFILLNALVEKFPHLLSTPNAKKILPEEEIRQALKKLKKNGKKNSDLYSNLTCAAGVILAHLVLQGQTEDIFTPPLRDLSTLCARYEGRLASFLPKKEMDVLTEVAREYEGRKKLGHAYTLSDDSSFEYEGSDVGFEQDLGKILGSPQEGVTEEERTQLKEAFEEAEKSETNPKGPQLASILQKIQNGDLVILPTGFLQHHMDIVFYKGLMVICNRGSRLYLTHNIEAFRIDPEKITEEILKNILIPVKPIQDHKYAEMVYRARWFFLNLPSKLSSSGKSEQDAFCKELSTISPSFQSSGNCTLASPKTAFRAALALLRTQGKKDEETPALLRESRKAAKHLGTRVRLDFLESYIKDQDGRKWVKSDNDLFEKILLRLEKRLEKYPIQQQTLDEYPRVKAFLEYRQKLKSSLE